VRLRRRTASAAASSAAPIAPDAAFRHACDSGFGQGCVDVGVALRDGVGVVADRAGARASFTAACSLAAPLGCFDGGVLLETGRCGAVEPDVALAVPDWLRCRRPPVLREAEVKAADRLRDTVADGGDDRRFPDHRDARRWARR